MKGWLRILNFYINSSIHVALTVCALTAVTVIRFDLKVPAALWFFIFFGTVTGYNFVKYAKIAKLYHHRLTDMLKVIQLFSLLSFGFLLYYGTQLSFETLFTAAAFGSLTFFYAVPLPFTKNLRTTARIKVFVVAVVWAGTTVLVPVVTAQSGIFTDVYLSFVQHILIVIVLTLPFEIRDLKYDQPSLKTLPQQFGIRKVKLFGFLLLFITLVLEGFRERFDAIDCLALLVVLLITATFLLKANEEQPKYYASFFVEGIPMIWCGLLLILRHFLT